MVQVQRFQRVLEHLEKKEILTVEEAVSLLGASAPTVRRDFKLLAKEQLIQRFRGGIKLVKYPVWEMTPVEFREVQHPLEKQALAEKAAELLCPGDVVIIDGGTTTAMMSEFIPDFQLQIITNSVRLVSALETRHHMRLNLSIYMTGGALHPHSGILLGPTTEATISQYHAGRAFLSVGGITDSHIYNTNELVVGTERAIIDAAETTVILADHSKIGKRAFSPVATLDKVDTLITDQFPENEEMLRKIENAGVHVITVSVSRLNQFKADRRLREEKTMLASGQNESRS